MSDSKDKIEFLFWGAGGSASGPHAIYVFGILCFATIVLAAVWRRWR